MLSEPAVAITRAPTVPGHCDRRQAEPARRGVHQHRLAGLEPGQVTRPYQAVSGTSGSAGRVGVVASRPGPARNARRATVTCEANDAERAADHPVAGGQAGHARADPADPAGALTAELAGPALGSG